MYSFSSDLLAPFSSCESDGPSYDTAQPISYTATYVAGAGHENQNLCDSAIIPG